jgi:antitoxin CptB
MSEAPETRLKRLRMRAWRRGTKEMDLILGPWADAHLQAASPQTLDRFEELLEENDQDLYAWIAGPADAAPVALSGLLSDIAAHARGRLAAGRPRQGSAKQRTV